MKFERVLATLGQETVSEMDGLDSEGLKKIVIEANTAIKDVSEELDRNEKYQLIKAQKTDLEQGKKEVNKRQKARISYALDLLATKALEHND